MGHAEGMDPQRLLLGSLTEVYGTFRAQMLALGCDVVEEVTRTQVSYSAVRKFAWLTPLTKTKALLIIDLWEERNSPLLRSVIRYRDDKFTHQFEVRAAADVDAVADLDWFDEAVSWGRKHR